MTSRILLLRHGCTPQGREHVFRGLTDDPLGTLGVRQARAVAECLEQAPIARLVSSPLRRARQTIEPLAERLGCPIEIAEGLNDMDFGDWEGRSLDELEESDPERLALWRRDPEMVEIPGGERLTQVAARVRETWRGLLEKSQNGDLLICSHRLILKILILDILHKPLKEFLSLPLDPASLSVVSPCDGGLCLERLNDIRHLAGLQPVGLRTDH